MVAIKITGGKIEPVIDWPPTANNLPLKEKIQERTGVPIARQALVWGDAAFANAVTINDIQLVPLPDSVRLVVEPLQDNPKFPIKVMISTGEVYLRVKETMTVTDFKRKIERKCAIPGEGMKVIRLGEEMEGDFPLSAYYINEGAEVEVIPTVFNNPQ